MPQTITKTEQGRIIGGTFTDRENADGAIEAFQALGIFPADIQVVVRLQKNPRKDVYTKIFTDRGLEDNEARRLDNEIREGKIVVAVYSVRDPAPVIDIFDRFGAEFDPDGSRNIRHDVLGMTTGAVAGAIAGGVIGVVAGGPLGAAAGATTGAVVGGGGGAVAGKAVEHSK